MNEMFVKMLSDVLQYCEANCNGSTYPQHVVIEGPMPIWINATKTRYDDQGMRHYIGLTQEGETIVDGYSLNCYGMNITLDARSNPQEVMLAYRLFGLDAQRERERSTKLVEIPKKAFWKAYKQAQHHASENRSYNPNDLYQDWVSDLQPEYRDALEAHKKGVTNEPN